MPGDEKWQFAGLCCSFLFCMKYDNKHSQIWDYRNGQVDFFIEHILKTPKCFYREMAIAVK